MSTNEPMTPAQMSAETGVPIETLRYYEREGLLQNVARASSGHRRYSHDDLLWVVVLRCLRATGMTIEQLREYCTLGEQGDHTKPERRQILLDHRAVIERQIHERQEALRLIDHKLEHYDAGTITDAIVADRTAHTTDLNAADPRTADPHTTPEGTIS